MTRPRRLSSSALIEPLEPRIAPATLVDARTILFNEADGDLVTVKFSKDVFTGNPAAQLAKANEVFKFDAGEVAQTIDPAQQLRLIDFTKLPTTFTGSIANGVSLTITAEQRAAGDGFADVGAIEATGISLGKVTIDGDLGQIDAGGVNFKIGLAGLTVQSLGARGTSTQIPVPTPTTDNPAPDLVSTITGALPALKVFDDVQEARLSVLHGRNAQGNLTTLGNLGSISIGGSLIGRPALAVASDQTGFIEADGNIGTTKIGAGVGDGIHGGGGKSSGRIRAGGSIASVTISGSIFGGAGLESGMIASEGSMGAVRIGISLLGGAGENSGVLRSFSSLAKVAIGVDLAAGTGAGSGVVFSRGAMGAVFIEGFIDGARPGAGAGSAGIFGGAGVASVTVLGHVFGGAQAQTGFIESGRDLGPVKILGHLTGGAGAASGVVLAHGKLAAFTLGGDLLGGAGAQSGLVRSGFDPLQPGDMGAVVIQGSVVGAGGDSSGSILSGGALRSVALGSKSSGALEVLRGGAGAFSGSLSGSGLIGAVKILGSVRGGGGDFSGALLSFDRMDASGEIAGDFGTVAISGSVVGGSGANSASILGDGALKSLTVAALQGGSGVGSASVQTGRGLFSAGNAGAIRILGGFQQAPTGIPGAGSAMLDIGGNLASLSIGGEATNATVHVGDALGVLSFGADVTNLTVTARGQLVPGTTTDAAIGRIAVKGDVSGSSFLAGYDATGAAVNPDAQIGAVTVAGAWTASNVVAGIAAGADAGFGNEQDERAPGFDNTAIVSRIASILIGGAVSGTAADGDHFGFVAQAIGKSKANGVSVALSATVAGEIAEFDAVNHDVSLREIL